MLVFMSPRELSLCRGLSARELCIFSFPLLLLFALQETLVQCGASGTCMASVPCPCHQFCSVLLSLCSAVTKPKQTGERSSSQAAGAAAASLTCRQSRPPVLPSPPTLSLRVDVPELYFFSSSSLHLSVSSGLGSLEKAIVFNSIVILFLILPLRRPRSL